MKDLNLEGNRDLATFVWPKVQKSLHYPSINEGNILNDMHHPRAWFKTPKKKKLPRSTGQFLAYALHTGTLNTPHTAHFSLLRSQTTALINTFHDVENIVGSFIGYLPVPVSTARRKAHLPTRKSIVESALSLRCIHWRLRRRLGSS